MNPDPLLYEDADSSYIRIKADDVVDKIVYTLESKVRDGYNVDGSKKYKIITTLSRNEEVEVISIENGWAKVKYNSKIGYVSNSYLKDKTDTTTVDTKYVNTGSLNVRSGPSTSYRILGVYKYGQEVKVVSVNNNWAKIKYNNGYAYVSNSTGKYFKYTAKATAPVSSNYLVKVTANALNIRKGPGTSYAVVGCIRDKGVYTMVQEQDGWGKLKSGAGWISLAYTQKR